MPPRSQTEKCIVNGCNRPFAAKGLCKMHHSRLMKKGNVGDEPKSVVTNKRNWITILLSSEIDKEACVKWPFSVDYKGYPHGYGPNFGERVLKFVCRIANGEQGNFTQVRHLCGRGHLGCINPFHLAWGNQSINEMDKVLHGTSSRGERNIHAKLDSKKVIEIRKSSLNSKELSLIYNVSARTIRDVRNRKSWDWLNEQMHA